MTHRDKSAVRGLIEELLAGGGDVDHADAMRRLLQAGLQELIEAEVAARIGAGRYERSEQRSTHRNGVRAKQLATPAGQVELARKLPGLQRIETSKVWPKEDGSATPAYRMVDLYFPDYDTASAAVATPEAAALFPSIFGLATGGLRILFADIEES